MACINCGKDFKDKRKDAKYCSVQCRDDFNNKRKKIERLASNIESSLQEIANICVDNPKLNPQGIKAIKRVMSKL